MADSGSTYVRALGKAFVGIELKKSKLPEIRKNLRELRTAGVKQLMGEIGEFWHASILPKHFTSANREYHLQPRAEKYLRRKRRIGIGQGKYVYNLLTGQTQRRMTYEYKVTATSRHATVRMNAPAYFTDPNDPNGNQPDKVKETLEVSSRDVALLTTFAHRRLNELAGVAIAARKAA